MNPRETESFEFDGSGASDVLQSSRLEELRCLLGQATREPSPTRVSALAAKAGYGVGAGASQPFAKGRTYCDGRRAK